MNEETSRGVDEVVSSNFARSLCLQITWSDVIDLVCPGVETPTDISCIDGVIYVATTTSRSFAYSQMSFLENRSTFL